MRRWLLPEHIEDILPAEARAIERLRRALLDLFASRTATSSCSRRCSNTPSRCSRAPGATSTSPPSAWSTASRGASSASAPTTRRRWRASTRTCSIARASRGCAYCGSVLHTLPAGMTTTREPIQIGAELYGHAGLEADLEVLRLMSRALVGARARASCTWTSATRASTARSRRVPISAPRMRRRSSTPCSRRTRRRCSAMRGALGGSAPRRSRGSRA